MNENHKYINQNDDGASSCSESTNEVFFEMLGLPVMELDAISSAVEDEIQIECNDIVESKFSPVADCKALERKAPSVSRLEVPNKCSRYLHKPSTVAAFVIENLIPESDCNSLIRLAEELSTSGFHYVTEASHVDNEGISYRVQLQEPNKHKLSVFEHEETLTKLWNTMKPVIVPHINQFTKETKSGPPIGLNPRLRVLRYDASDNDVFDPHFDATTRVLDKESSTELTSLLTVLIYLNDGGGKDFDGGETYYLDSTNPNADPTIVVPSTGSVVVFEHDLYHSSVPLKFGTKFVLRTDILFKLSNGSGVDNPRGIGKGTVHSNSNANTLLELCEELDVCEHAKSCINEIGLLDLTLESLIAPGITAVRQMLLDVLDEDIANLIVNSLSHYTQK